MGNQNTNEKGYSSLPLSDHPTFSGNISINTHACQAFNGARVHHYENALEALKLYNAALSYDSTNPVILYFRGTLFLEELKKPEDALSDFTAVTMYHKNKSDGLVCSSLFNMGIIYHYMTGSYKEALICYSNVIEKRSFKKIALVFLNRGKVREEIGDYLGAYNDYSKAIEHDPKFSDAFYQRGLLQQIQFCTSLERSVQAILDFSSCIKLNPHNIKARLQRARLLQDFDRNEEAISELSKILEIKADHTDALFFRAMLYSHKVYSPEKAIQDFSTLLSLPIDQDRTISCLRSRAKIYRNQHYYDLSDKDSEEVRKLESDEFSG